MVDAGGKHVHRDQIVWLQYQHGYNKVAFGNIVARSAVVLREVSLFSNV